MVDTLPPPRIEQRTAAMRLAPGWGRTVFLGWTGTIAALACVGISSHIIGRPVFWLDDQRWSPAILVLLAILVTGPSVFAAVWSYANRSWIPAVSAVASAVLVMAAVIDRHTSPGAAVVIAALAAAGVLLTVASYLGRLRPAHR